MDARCSRSSSENCWIPSDTTARFLRALCLQKLERKDEAVAEMEQVLVKDPYHALTLKALIAIYGTDPAQASKVGDYKLRLQRLAKSKPPPAPPVKGGS